ncbi:MAG: hypothetical protein AAF193_11225, partial [Bacteroidota bacterium]
MSQAAIHPNAEGGLDAHCGNCGAKLEFAPGTHQLNCPYCGTENEIPEAIEDVEEIALDDFLHQQNTEHIDVDVLECSGCGALNPFDAVKVAKDCMFCGAHLLVKDATKKHQIKPGALIPFKL